jgi:hypothetical protein
MNRSASLPLVIHSFLPAIVHSSPRSTARVVSANASLPDPASESA